MSYWQSRKERSRIAILSEKREVSVTSITGDNRVTTELLFYPKGPGHALLNTR